MTSLADARKKLPNLASLDDAQFVDAVHELYYPTMDKAELSSKLGYTPPEAPKPPAGLLRTAGDVGIKTAQGVVDLGASVVGLGSLATGGLVGKGMRAIGYDPERTKEAMGEYLSDAQKAADEKVSKADGFVDSVVASVQNPRAILGSIAQSAPGMIGGMGVSSAVAGRIAAKAALATAEGAAASAAELAAGKTATEAAAAAIKTAAGKKAADAAIEAAGTRLIATGAATEGAQSAGQIADGAQAKGREYSDYVAPALAAGAGTALIGLGAGKLMGDSATQIATGAHSTAVKGSMLKRAGKEFLSEGVLEEMPQSAQEQVFTNMAEGEKDLTKGVANAAGTGLITGGVMGAGMGAVQKHEPAALPNTGPLSQAANAGTAAQAALTARAAGTLTAPPPAEPQRPLADIDARLAQLLAIGQGTPEQATQDAAGNPVVIPATPARRYTPQEKAEYEELTAERHQRTSIPRDQLDAWKDLVAQEAAEKSATMKEGQQPAIDAVEQEKVAAAQKEAERRKAVEDAELARIKAEDYAQKQAREQEQLSVTNAIVDQGMVDRAAANRAALRNDVLNDAKIPASDKKTAFAAALKREGYMVPVLNDEDHAAIDKHAIDAYEASLDDAIASAPIPAAPNELVDAVPERKEAPPPPAGTNTAAVDAAIAAGMRLKTPGGSVLHKPGSGKIFKLSSAQKAHYLKRMESPAEVGVTENDENAPVLAQNEAVPAPNDAQIANIAPPAPKDDVAAPAPATQQEQRQAAYDASIERHNIAVRSYKDAQASGDTPAMEAAKKVIDAERARQRTISLGSVHADLAKAGAQRTIEETARIAAMPIGTRARPSEFAPEKGIHLDKTSADEWTWRGQYKAGEILTDRKMAERGGFLYTEPSPEAQAFDAAAHEAATSPHNELAEPTEAQKEAGNYKVGRVKLHGLDLSIENPAGSVRKGVDKSGKPWETTMQQHYGYIRGTVGADKDHIDTFIGKNLDSDKVFVVDQIHPDSGKFDEHKVMLGFDSIEEARAAYQANYDASWTGGRDITETTVDGFKSWLASGKTKKPFAPKGSAAPAAVPAEVPRTLAGLIADAKANIAELKSQQAEAKKVGNDWVYNGRISKAEAELADYERAAKEQAAPEAAAPKADAPLSKNEQMARAAEGNAEYDGEESAMRGFSMHPPQNWRKQAERDAWERGWVRGREKRDAMLSGAKRVTVGERTAFPTVAVKDGEWTKVWRDESAGKDYRSAEDAQAALQTASAADEKTTQAIDALPTRAKLTKQDLNKMTVKDMTDDQLLQAREVFKDGPRAPKIEKEILQRGIDSFVAGDRPNIPATPADHPLIKQLRDQGRAPEHQVSQANREIEQGDETLARDLLRIYAPAKGAVDLATFEQAWARDVDPYSGAPIADQSRRSELFAELSELRDAAKPKKAAEVEQEDAPAKGSAPEHARVTDAGPQSEQFTSPEFKAAHERATAAQAWEKRVVEANKDWFTGTGNKRKLLPGASTELQAEWKALKKEKNQAFEDYNAVLTAPKYGTATGDPVNEQAPIDESIVPMTMEKSDFATITNEWADLFAEPAADETVRLDWKTVPEQLTVDEADARIEEWKAHVKKQFDEHRSENSQKTILSLFDLTGEWSKPWREAGYNVIQFDIQSGQDVFDFSAQYFVDNYDLTDVYGILAASPCTDFASSGAKHFLGKDKAGQTEQSVELVTQTARTIEYFRPAIWGLENPVGRLSNLTGLPSPRLIFQPNAFGDPYTKETMIWGRFNADLPTANVDPVEGSKMHRLYGGKSIETKNARSETPEGFAYAFFMANNYIDMPAERKLPIEYPEASGAVLAALKAGVSEERIHELMYDTYGNYEYEEARNVLVQEVADMQKGDAQEAAPAEPEGDTGADIPRAFFKKVKVPHEVWIEEEGRYETVEVTADKALASVREDLANLRDLLACMKG